MYFLLCGWSLLCGCDLGSWPSALLSAIRQPAEFHLGQRKVRIHASLPRHRLPWAVRLRIRVSRQHVLQWHVASSEWDFCLFWLIRCQDNLQKRNNTFLTYFGLFCFCNSGLMQHIDIYDRGAQSAAPWAAPLVWRQRSSNVQAGGHGRSSMPERSGTSVPHYSLCFITVQPEKSLFHWAKSITRTTSPTQHVRPRPLGFCHCWSICLEQSSRPCLQSRLHQSCWRHFCSHCTSAPSVLCGIFWPMHYRNVHIEINILSNGSEDFLVL